MYGIHHFGDPEILKNGFRRWSNSSTMQYTMTDIDDLANPRLRLTEIVIASLKLAAYPQVDVGHGFPVPPAMLPEVQQLVALGLASARSCPRMPVSVSLASIWVVRGRSLRARRRWRASDFMLR